MFKVPAKQGLYDPAYEHDACGVGLLANIDGAKSHEIVERGLQVLENMEHRGAEGADERTGDGAGIMVQIPHEFILLQGIPLPERGRYGVAMVFLPKEESSAAAFMDIFREEVEAAGLTLQHVRDVPVNSDVLGTLARASEPDVKQLFITAPHMPQDELERKLYVTRRRIENRVLATGLEGHEDFYVCSLSTRVVVYKGMLISRQLRQYYPDLLSPWFTSGLALVHSRFSTNTAPRWPLAQPFRYLGHNGEINTIRGNRSWMSARETVLDPGRLGGMKDLVPIVQEGMSDSASFDNVLEFFVESGMSLPHALAMMVPESFNSKNPISQELKDFFEYHSIMMEPWDGPAALLFSDGRYAGGMLDRNGLRPCRYLITKERMLMMASETGVLQFDANEIAEKGRLQPGKILLIDMETGQIHYDPEVKAALAGEHPYGEWLQRNRIWLDHLSSGRKAATTVDNYMQMMTAFGYSQEDLTRIIVPMAQTAQEPTWSMGNDAPLAAFSRQPQRLFAYFRQQFAQVTNPPIDPIREKLVMSLDGYVGSIDSNLLEPNPELCKMVRLSNPILTNTQFDLLCNIAYKGFKAVKADMLFPVAQGTEGLHEAVRSLCRQAEAAVDGGADYIILTDRNVSATHAPVPSLLATSAVHSYLIERHKRCQIGLIIESAEPREVMHFALLMGFGASAICPYLAFAAIQEQIARGELPLDYHTAVGNYITAISKGLLKIMSKMGISTLMSYKGARIFEVAGLDREVMDEYFGGADSKITGIGLDEIADEAMRPHAEAFRTDAPAPTMLPNFGHYVYRRDGERHAWNPETISTLQIATRLGSYKKYKEYAALVNGREEPMFIRDFMDFRRAAAPVPLDEVEPAEAIMRRFATGAMSFGAISKEAHEALAIAMNAIGGRSNTGEGGEDSARFYIPEGEPNVRSAIKQVASGRFGVTTEYLVNADEIQIKIAQGAKPGEGGQLPGFKVDEVIARTRHAMPGITLISPPPHHDIYSIEDLAQLIFDLKNVNPSADISVKLVSESGIGTIAAGVAKAKADRIIISGADGGTGASPASSTKHAGMPPEIGLAETQQTLIINRLRGQVRLQTDGQLKTGRDAMLMALLGAEEFAFATTALIVLGCVMMRKCHMNTCPVGVATQNPTLRERFRGRAEYLVTYFRFVAEEMREYLAQMGFRTMDEVIGRADLIETRTFDANAKTHRTDVTRLLHVPAEAAETATHCVKPQHHNIDDVKDAAILKVATPAIQSKMPIQLSYHIQNTDRAVGAMLSGAIARRYGQEGLPADTITVSFKGSAGQSFGAFLTAGLHFRLVGDANDYLGKGLSGGKITVIPPAGTSFAADENIICGNTLLYGATSGEVFINGRVGERFAVRNSGATAVIEGAGDHCCEYMTGGVVVVLGSVGRNFAAGMSAGVAYVLDTDHDFDYFCNMEMVELSLVEDMYDVRELRALIERHVAETGSPKGRRILDAWAETLPSFIKVTPIEYKRVLIEQRLRELQARQAEVTHQE